MKTKKLIINDEDKDIIDVSDIDEYFKGIIIVLIDSNPSGFIIYSEDQEEWQYCNEISCTGNSTYYDYKLIDLLRELKSKYLKISFEVIPFKL